MVIVGLDYSGKTAILYRLKLNQFVHTIHTLGFNVEDIKYRNAMLSVWDINCSGKLRHLVRHYYSNAHAIILVVDASAPLRMGECKEFFE